MATRALIIAVEEYASADGLAKELPGTLQAGLNFQQWLMAKLQAENRAADYQVLFCSDPTQPNGYGASRADVLNALLKLKEDGRGRTEELFFFFSGHGFAFVDKPNSRADVIITSDFRNSNISGDCCLNLDQIVNWLRDHLGPGKHYYFIDACRNNLNGSQVTVGSLLPTDLNAMPDASTFVLQSTVPGAVAMAGGLFPTTLMQGLQGQGTAKIWDLNRAVDAMFVRYDSLRTFIKKSLEQKQPITSKVSGEVGENEVVFTTISPVPKVRCTIQIEGFGPGIQGVVKIKRGRVEEQPIAISAAFPAREMEPDTYTVSVTINGASIVPPFQSVDLYDDSIITFQMRPASSGGQGFEMAGGDSTNVIVLPEAKPSIPRLTIANRLPGTYDAPYFFEFKDGPVGDPDLDLWLALLGGGRILGPNGASFNLSRFPLHDFADEHSGTSPVYVLAGFEDPEAKLSISVSNEATPHWQPALEPDGMAGIREAYAATRPGPKLVSFRLADQPAYTVASISSPNRVTLITLTLDEGEFRVGQYLLPLGHLIGHLPEEMLLLLKQGKLFKDVRFLAQAYRVFRKRQNVFKDALMSKADLHELLIAKWFDPMAASLATYELLRRGQREEATEVVGKMQRDFPDFPDTAALANFTGKQMRPAGPPLFFDGLRAFADVAAWLPLPASHLNYNSPWTAWRAAVN